MKSLILRYFVAYSIPNLNSIQFKCITSERFLSDTSFFKNQKNPDIPQFMTYQIRYVITELGFVKLLILRHFAIYGIPNLNSQPESQGFRHKSHGRREHRPAIYKEIFIVHTVFSLYFLLILKSSNDNIAH